MLDTLKLRNYTAASTEKYPLIKPDKILKFSESSVANYTDILTYLQFNYLPFTHFTDWVCVQLPCSTLYYMDPGPQTLCAHMLNNFTQWVTCFGFLYCYFNMILLFWGFEGFNVNIFTYCPDKDKVKVALSCSQQVR